MEGAAEMSQQCVNCKWWDRENAGRYADDPFEPSEADCLYLTPFWVREQKSTYEHQGQNCQAYEERRECDTVEDLPEFLKKQAD